MQELTIVLDSEPPRARSDSIMSKVYSWLSKAGENLDKAAPAAIKVISKYLGA